MGLFKLQEEFKIHESFLSNDKKKNNVLTKQQFSSSQKEIKSWLSKNAKGGLYGEDNNDLTTKINILPYNTEGKIINLRFKGASTADWKWTKLVLLYFAPIIGGFVYGANILTQSYNADDIASKLSEKSKSFNYRLENDLVTNNFTNTISINIYASPK